MRRHGTLAKWNDDRGFGFITPAQGSGDIFVHISAFPRDGTPPRIGELISFEVEAGAEGKTRAVRIMRPGGQTPRRGVRHGSRSSGKNRPLAGVLSLLALGAIAVYGYSEFRSRSAAGPAPQALQARTPVAQRAAQAFRCDGRTHCSQMRSCAEATYFVQHCPNTQMDGNGDGVPCEQQWCN